MCHVLTQDLAHSRHSNVSSYFSRYCLFSTSEDSRAQVRKVKRSCKGELLTFMDHSRDIVRLNEEPGNTMLPLNHPTPYHPQGSKEVMVLWPPESPSSECSPFPSPPAQSEGYLSVIRPSYYCEKKVLELGNWVEPRDSQDSWGHSEDPQDFLAVSKLLRESNVILQEGTESSR